MLSEVNSKKKILFYEYQYKNINYRIIIKYIL